MTLHVGAHQSPVGVIILQEGNHRRCDGNDLLGRNVHVIDFCRRYFQDVVAITDADAFFCEPAIFVQLFVRLGNHDLVFFVRRLVMNVFSNPQILFVDFAVRGFDETELIYPAKRRQRTDQSDVRTFRRLDRTHPAIVGVVNVAHFKSGAFPAESTRTESAESALVSQFSQRIGLVHKLGQLAGTKEFLDCSNNRSDVDQRLRRDNVHILYRHAFTHDAFHPGQADSELVL